MTASPRAHREAMAGASVAIKGAVGPRRRLPVLDGWRGLSILLVLATHAAARTPPGHPTEAYALGGRVGRGLAPLQRSWITL